VISGVGVTVSVGVGVTSGVGMTSEMVADEVESSA